MNHTMTLNRRLHTHPRAQRTRWVIALLLLALAAWVSACDGAEQSPSTDTSGADTSGGTSGGTADSTSGGADVVTDPGTSADVSLPAEQQAAFAALREQLGAARTMTFDDLAPSYALPFAQTLPYDPLTATGLDLIDAAFSLTDAERALLSSHGFATTARQQFPSFVYGYETIYMHDLPLYVSADSILHAVHRSYDDILQTLEVAALSGELKALLEGMRAKLALGLPDIPAQAQADADLYLAVALSLLTGEGAPVVGGGDAAQVSDLVQKATAASGAANLTLFGVARDMDFSQFTPRGHYTDSEELKRYFRAMMWFGRVDLRLIETQQDGSQVFHRRQAEGALALTALLDMPRWKRIDDTIRVFVGESDNMTPPQMDGLFADLGVTSAAQLLALDDATLAQAIIDGRYGEQRISSHIMINGLGEGTLPLSATYLVFGQRYVVDSHVFSNVVYDRVQGGAVKRMMPDPLDVAMAALGNNQAFGMLEAGLRQYSYASDLHSMRLLVDAHGADFWELNLYNLWLDAIRAMSPDAAEVADPGAAGLPAVAATEAWGRRVLGAQLASWAELRHDTILYAKQSYTGGATCEFPDAYIDPYPALYNRLARFAERGEALADTLDLSAYPELVEGVQGYFSHLRDTALTLEGMATKQRQGQAFSAEELAFINRAVAIQMGCGDPAGVEGWYADLFYQPVRGVDFDPTIADVHTQPTDEGGAPVGRVLHVGTGMPRLMVVTVDTCQGPRAYAGLSSSYFEVVTEDFDRLDDIRWSEQLTGDTPPAEVPWLSPLIAR
jgi:hypothetical protein